MTETYFQVDACYELILKLHELKKRNNYGSNR